MTTDGGCQFPIGSYRLYVDDLENGTGWSLEMWKQPRALAYNPATGHLFAALVEGARRDVDFSRELRIWRASDLQEVASLPFPGAANALAVDPAANWVYLSDAASGQVFVAQDAAP